MDIPLLLLEFRHIFFLTCGFRLAKKLVILLWKYLKNDRSSHIRCSIKKVVLENYPKLTGKHLCQSLFFNKVAFAACNFIKKETLALLFSCKFHQILRTPFYNTSLNDCFWNDKKNFLFLHKSSFGLIFEVIHWETKRCLVVQATCISRQFSDILETSQWQ